MSYATCQSLFTRLFRRSTMRLSHVFIASLFVLHVSPAASDESAPWVIGGGAHRSVDSWPSETNKVTVSEHYRDGGTRLCAATISPRLPGPNRYLSVQHFQGQNGFTFVAYQEDWIFLQGTVVQLSAIFDRKNSVILAGTAFGPEIKFGSDFGATPRINTLLSESESLDVEFPWQPGLTWRIGLQGMSEAMAKLRQCASKPYLDHRST